MHGKKTKGDNINTIVNGNVTQEWKKNEDNSFLHMLMGKKVHSKILT